MTTYIEGFFNTLGAEGGIRSQPFGVFPKIASILRYTDICAYAENKLKILFFHY